MIHRTTSHWLQLIVLLACVATSAAHAQLADVTDWTIEQGVEIPSYAMVEPTITNVNIDRVVLACEDSAYGRFLQLQLFYLFGEGPLRPKGVSPRQLKHYPRAQISIDGKKFPVAVLFADHYAVLADSQYGSIPLLSDRLVDAMQFGKMMILRFDLVTEPLGRPASFGGEAIVALQASGAHEAIAVMRRCVDSSQLHGVSDRGASPWG
jgi:hypothetical protein